MTQPPALNLLSAVLLGGGLWGAAPAEGAGEQTPSSLGRIAYNATSPVFEGTVTVELSEGTWEETARPLPYAVPSESASASYGRHRRRRIVCATGNAESNLLPHYRIETYLEPTTRLPLRSVRWKNGIPDVVLDYVEPGSVVLTRAKAGGGSTTDRLKGLFGVRRGRPAPTLQVESTPLPLRLGPAMTDLLTAFLRLPAVFRNAGQIGGPLHRFGIKKRPTSMYCAVFVPHEERELTVRLADRTLSRKSRRFSWTISYACAVTLPGRPVLSRLAQTYYPDRSEADVESLLRGVLGGDLAVFAGETVALPISPSVHTAVFKRSGSPSFEPPYGLSEAGDVWFDCLTGVPLRVEGRLYGIKGEVTITEASGEFALGSPR